MLPTGLAGATLWPGVEPDLRSLTAGLRDGTAGLRDVTAGLRMSWHYCGVPWRGFDETAELRSTAGTVRDDMGAPRDQDRSSGMLMPTDGTATLGKLRSWRGRGCRWRPARAPRLVGGRLPMVGLRDRTGRLRCRMSRRRPRSLPVGAGPGRLTLGT